MRVKDLFSVVSDNVELVRFFPPVDGKPKYEVLYNGSPSLVPESLLSLVVLYLSPIEAGVFHIVVR